MKRAKSRVPVFLIRTSNLGKSGGYLLEKAVRILIIAHPCMLGVYRSHRASIFTIVKNDVLVFQCAFPSREIDHQ